MQSPSKASCFLDSFPKTPRPRSTLTFLISPHKDKTPSPPQGCRSPRSSPTASLVDLMKAGIQTISSCLRLTRLIIDMAGFQHRESRVILTLDRISLPFQPNTPVPSQCPLRPGLERGPAIYQISRPSWVTQLPLHRLRLQWESGSISIPKRNSDGRIRRAKLPGPADQSVCQTCDPHCIVV